ncbi:MAG TPA: O-methyltransferase [Micromonosporaceae bacterium]
MSDRTITVTDELRQYVLAHSTPVDSVARDLIEETHAALPEKAVMQVSPDQAAFLTLMTKIVGARQAVEVGTFTGYSALAIARGLGDGGRLLCCDLSEEWTSVARRYWKRSGVADRIELRIAPAVETLRDLPREPYLDLAFIDADKVGYVSYWDELVPRMRPGGVILVDNVLWSGRVTETDSGDATVQAIRAFNEHAAADTRMETVILPIADGITLSRRR